MYFVIENETNRIVFAKELITQDSVKTNGMNWSSLLFNSSNSSLVKIEDSDIPDNFVAGFFTYVDGVIEPLDDFEDVIAEILSEKNAAIATQVRKNRNALLDDTQWRASSDLTMTEEMTAYRQALRDVPQQDGFPNDIDWPEQP